MFAIIETSGSQLIVRKDDVVFLEKINGKVGETITFDKVLMLDKRIGKPYLENAFVTGVIQKQGKQKKIIVFRHNHKSTHKKKYGHRQLYTRVKIMELKG